MDGMEMSRRIKAEYPATKILFLLDLMNLNMPKVAVHLRRGIYSKTRKCSELTNVFTRLKIKLIREISEKRNVEILRSTTWIHFLFCRQTSIYVSLSKAAFLMEEEILWLSLDYQLSFPGPFFAALIHTSSNLGACEYESSSAGHLGTQAGKRTAGRKWRAKCFFLILESQLRVPQLRMENEVSELTGAWCSDFCKYAKEVLGAVVTVGIGSRSRIRF